GRRAARCGRRARRAGLAPPLIPHPTFAPHHRSAPTVTVTDQQQPQQQQPQEPPTGTAAATVTDDGRPVFRVDGIDYEITGLEPEDAREILDEVKARQRDPSVMVAQELERLEALGLPTAQRDRLAQNLADRLFDVLL